MCCPGNYCKNGESPSPFWASVSHAAIYGREENAPGLADSMARGHLQVSAWPRGALDKLQVFDGEECVEVLGLCAPRRFNTTAHLPGSPSMKTCL